MKLRTTSFVLASLGIGFIAGVPIGMASLWLNHVELHGNIPVAIVGSFVGLLGGLLYIIACEIEIHSDAEEVNQ